MVVPAEWDRRHRWEESRRTMTVLGGNWLGGLGALALYDGQNNAFY